MLRFLHIVLAESGLRVHACERWDTLAHTAADVRPDIVVLDLPIDDETQCCAALRELRARAETRATPVLVCAAAPWQSEEYAEMLDLPNVSLWSDPFDLRQLSSTLDRLLARHATRRVRPVARKRFRPATTPPGGVPGAVGG